MRRRKRQLEIEEDERVRIDPEKIAFQSFGLDHEVLDAVQEFHLFRRLDQFRYSAFTALGETDLFASYILFTLNLFEQGKIKGKTLFRGGYVHPDSDYFFSKEEASSSSNAKRNLLIKTLQRKRSLVDQIQNCDRQDIPRLEQDLYLARKGMGRLCYQMFLNFEVMDELTDAFFRTAEQSILEGFSSIDQVVGLWKKYLIEGKTFAGFRNIKSRVHAIEADLGDSLLYFSEQLKIINDGDFCTNENGKTGRGFYREMLRVIDLIVAHNLRIVGHNIKGYVLNKKVGYEEGFGIAARGLLRGVMRMDYKHIVGDKVDDMDSGKEQGSSSKDLLALHLPTAIPPKYDPVRFSTFTTWWIMHALKLDTKSVNNLVHIPVYHYHDLNEFKKKHREFRLLHNRFPLPEEIGYTEEEVGLYHFMEIGPKRMNSPLNESGRVSNFGSLIEDSSAESPMKLAHENGKYQKIERTLQSLDYNERAILKLIYGIFPIHGEDLTLKNRNTDESTHMRGYTSDTYSLEAIGEFLGLSRERVRQISAKAMRKLMHPARQRMVYGLMDDLWESYESLEVVSIEGDSTNPDYDEMYKRLGILNGRDQKIIKLRYGLFPKTGELIQLYQVKEDTIVSIAGFQGDAYTLKEVAQITGLTQKRIKYIESNARNNGITKVK